MGVSFRLAFYAPSESLAEQAADAAFERVAELDGILSDYDPGSELMRLCAEPERRVKVSRDLATVLGRSLELSRQSGGAFDVSVGPYVALWREARRSGRMPRARALRAAARLVGPRLVELDPVARTVRLQRPGMRLDLGGIAKGYAVDQAMALLRKRGITRALVDGGGDILAGDPPPGREGWVIAIQALRPGGEPGPRVVLARRAIATSGDLEQAVVIDGRRYSHIVDPRTGLALTGPSSVTVLAPDCMTADALATAVSVLGPVAGLRLVEEVQGAEALYVRIRDGKLESFRSGRFEAELGTSR